MTPRNLLPIALLALAACDGGGTGTVQVFVEAEDTIPEGLQPGDGAEDVVDGWTVKYDKFIVTVGDFRASRSEGDGDTLSAPTIYVVDLLHVPAGGVVLAEFEDVAAERWDQVGYSMPNATDEAVAAEGTAKADRDMMVAGGLSLYVAGEITKPDGESCGFDDPVVCTPAPSVRFAWGLQAGTSFSDCAPPTGALGFAVPSGGTAQVKPTIHGDHWFFTNLTQGSEVTERRAQWIADADLDLDGETTLEELGDLSATLLFTAERGYNLSGSIIKIVTAYDYLEAQARTLGDFQGEGECPTRKIL
jgi:hypothetical protein